MNNADITDISNIDLTSRVTIVQPKDLEYCARLKSKTLARICVGRAGERYRTETWLRFRADHAVAMDAVWSEVDETVLEPFGFFKAQTLIHNKEEYITRPDLGRRFSPEVLGSIKANCLNNPEVQLVVADGLSSPAITENIADIYPIMLEGFKKLNLRVGTPIFVKYGRVATMDRISEALQAKVTILLVGERPGLATGESMGCYMAYEASTQKPESQRTVLSNIHKNGTPPVEAGAHLVSLTEIMLQEKKSGVNLKL